LHKNSGRQEHIVGHDFSRSPDIASAAAELSMAAIVEPGPVAAARLNGVLPLLRCPETGQALVQDGNRLVTLSGDREYPVSPGGIPVFAARLCSDEARKQEAHYEKIASAYIENLAYPHTEEYAAALDRALLAAIADADLGTAAEVCCGRGEAFRLFQDRIRRGVGVDISLSMLDAAQRENHAANVGFVQGDATMLPLANGTFDNVFMLGGIHHVNNRRALFGEIARVLKPGGWFYFREPVSDFALWRWIRAIIYRLSPTLDHETERPLRWRETVPLLGASGLACRHWSTHGFFGFCLFMNSDVLVFNRLFRFLPGIRPLTRVATRIDDAILSLPFLRHAGLQVVGAAQRRQVEAIGVDDLA
jgi:ubiquinone/menaquinone biosynthesis C-methylase UbiE